MVDRDLFHTDGVMILNTNTWKMSVLKIRPTGQRFLSQQLKSDNITVQCLAVLDDINVYGGEIYRIEIFGKSILASMCQCGSCTCIASVYIQSDMTPISIKTVGVLYISNMMVDVVVFTTY